MTKARAMRVAGPIILLQAVATAALAGGGEVGPLLTRIKAVGREGAGNAEAGKAWRELSRCGPEALPAILAGFDGADDLASNWLRAAVDTIAERTVKAGRGLPAARLESFIRQEEHAPAARRLAYEWLARVDAAASDRLLPDMLRDPSPELRRDAVERVIQEARRQRDRGEKAGAIAAFRKALVATLDRDQADQTAKDLKALGVSVDLAAHFGLIRDWMLIGPFDSSGGAGFGKAYPPEKTVELAATYTGKNGKVVRWSAYTTPDAYGVVDLNKALGKHMGAAAYAFAAVTSPAARSVQIRAGSNNALKIFLNGKELFSREEYHHGMDMDQHVAHGQLRAGRNDILVKVCQNEQTDAWAQDWAFQLRVCDAAGAAVHLASVAVKPVMPAGRGEEGR